MNEEKFSGKAAVYAAHRPGYPAAYIQYLYAEIGLSAASVLADIGAGTGILTRLLLERGSTVYAVEPNADMRRAAEQTLADFPAFRSIAAPAEETTLPAGSLDTVTVAQAFHWFDRPRFLAECRRILKADAPVALVWNMRDESAPLVQANMALLRAHCPRFQGFGGGMPVTDLAQFRDFFRDGVCDARVFHHDLPFDEDGFIGRNLSGSYAPKPEDTAYAPFIAAVRELFAQYSKNGQLILPNLTYSFVGKV